ncbi:MAG: ribose-phosphate diphosphokinase [Candidatus Obscuribacterales bacterium]|nr:ribose-phosphate diphosphokinase [Candidatus Obscuribacterales bacterium]
MSKPLVFATKSYINWTAALQAQSGLEAGAVERKSFPDGEHYHRVLSPVDDREVLIVSGTISDSETLELFDLANAIVDGGALRLKVFLPYFGYSTMERAVKSGDAVKAKYRARLLSNGIPRAPMGNRFFMLDLHAEGIPQYFENGVQTKHIYAKQIVMRAAQSLAQRHGSIVLASKELEAEGTAPGGGYVLASTDAGRMKWVESLAKDLGISPAFAYKERIDGSTTVSLGVSGPVKGKFVVIYDDMIRTGSSLMNAARAYLQAGASGIAAIATHALFPGDALAKIQSSALFKEIVVTDSHPRSRELESEFLKVESCVELFLPHTNGTAGFDTQSREFQHAKA